MLPQINSKRKAFAKFCCQVYWNCKKSKIWNANGLGNLKSNLNSQSVLPTAKHFELKLLFKKVILKLTQYFLFLGFEALKESLPSSNKDASSILISPLFRSSKNEDVIHVSLSNPFEQPFEVYLVSSEFQIQVNMTSERCQYGFISNPAFGSESITYRMVVFSKAILSTSDRLRGSVTSHVRPTFEDIVTYANEDTPDPKFVTVPIGTRNLCSAEILNEVTECDWKIVLHADNDRFQLHDHHDCIDQGVSHHKDDGYVWFVALEPSRPTSSAYLISPIIKGGSSHFLLSFWALPRCNDTTLRAYIVPSYQHIQGVKTDLKRLIYEKHYNKSNQDWIFTFESIEIPTTYETFQVNTFFNGKVVKICKWLLLLRSQIIFS